MSLRRSARRRRRGRARRGCRRITPATRPLGEEPLQDSEEMKSTNILHVEKKTRFPGYNTLTNMQKDCILGALEQNVATFAKHPQQWLTQWYLQMG